MTEFPRFPNPAMRLPQSGWQALPWQNPPPPPFEKDPLCKDMFFVYPVVDPLGTCKHFAKIDEKMHDVPLSGDIVWRPTGG